MPTQPPASAEDQRRIISASRRTDIPAWYSEWFIARLREGRCAWRHPFSRKWHQVSLAPTDVSAIVFWTRDIAPLLSHLPWIRERCPFYVQYTITDLGEPLEPGVAATADAIACARRLSERFGPDVLVWRFDPIVLTPDIGPEETIRRFEGLARSMEGLTDCCVTSFMAPYRRQRRAFSSAGVENREPPADLKRELAGALADCAAGHGIRLHACCTPDIAGAQVTRARCIDPDRLRRLGATLPEGLRAAPSRPGCGCYRAVDIGAYDTCPAGCLYCYANSDPVKALRNWRAHEAARLALACACVDDQIPG